ncbi:flagellin N-terminal helical domain-containing protein [Methyloversatilis thermotolerans]|uniref:flagellin N-terminal helical domain-containing protein n=1 Tax=Methyloversatilis thermotolerans TaxID=1346290 RepID=UPI000372BB45|nr:flagellin [Methyloversatilis thermotolerans]
MPQIINTNVASLTAQRNLNASQNSLSTSLQRLSSGLRINSAKDDAAGLAISERMSSQVRGLNQAVRNANDAISLTQTAEGAMTSISEGLQRMRELSVQSANDSNSASDRQALQQEVAQLQQEINRIATTTQFNGKNLLDGSFAGQYFQVGANANQTIGLSLNNTKATNIGANTVTATGTLNNAVAAAAGAGARVANTVLAGEDLTVTGSIGTKAIAVNAGDSANTVAAAVNAETASTGVQATALTEATLSNLGATGTVSFTLFGSNSTGVAISATVGNTADLSSLSTAINNYAATTGISATVSGGTITLKSEQGYDISITDFANTAGATGTIDLRGRDAFAGTNSGAAVTLGAAAGTDSSTVGGTLKFTSSEAFSVTSAATAAATNGLFVSATANASSLSSVAAINVGSQTGANAAIDVIDAALQSINTQRAALGAVQNRVTNTIANLQTTSENVSSARSRILDADFAAETANLTRAQILQQAGTAMLAQANSLPQNVLSLLRG